MTSGLVGLPFFLCPASNFSKSYEHFIVLNRKGLNQPVRCHFDFSHVTQVLHIALCCLLLSLPLPWQLWNTNSTGKDW